jgi:AIPR protein
MLISKFYAIINSELETILNKYSDDSELHKHKDNKLNKGYALLIWFLDFYAQKEIYKSFITDGNDERSCDIIFSNKNNQDEEIFYVIQSKWINFDTTKKKEDAYPVLKKLEFGYALNDFSVVLSGQKKKGVNEAFNKKYEALKTHLEKNGKVKFIFFTPARRDEESKDSIEESINAFNKNYAPNISLEVIDIERIRRDYIEFKYKEIQTNNPLEYAYNSEDAPIEINIERFKDSKRDVLAFEGREKSYILMLKPKTIYELFNKFRFSLFFKNVRNPIHRSNYNQQIVDTLLKKPSAFWYFNNGITGITKVMPDVGVHAKKIQVEGLQIINGAQTVYSVFKAYENATSIQRKAMDSDAKISFRLIRSSDEDFNMQITRFTNMQNPLHDRDFWANDDVQQRLQNESFATDFWYEKRRDEFRLTTEQQEQLGITIVPNSEFIAAYCAFYLQNPVSAVQQTDKFFISKRDDKDGLYEEIFNSKTKFDDILVSYFLYLFAEEVLKESTIEVQGEQFTDEVFSFSIMPVIALSRIVMQKYFTIKRGLANGKELNLNLLIKNIYQHNNQKDTDELYRILIYTIHLIVDKLHHEDSEKLTTKYKKLMNNLVVYETIKEEVEDSELNIEAIQKLEISWLEPPQ